MATNLTISDGFQLDRNQAIEYAPGIYNGANLYVSDQRDLTNGVYLENRSAVVQLLSELPDGSMIQIDRSNYVTPDVSKAPIVIAEATPTHPVLTENDRKAFLKPPTGFENWVVALLEGTKIVLTLESFQIEYFNLMGATNPNPTSYNIETPTFSLLSPSPVPGYAFVGWFDEAGNQVTEIKQGSSGDLRLYARWESNQRTITHNGNDTPSTPASNLPDPILFAPGDDVRLSSTIPIRKGYLFLNWNTKKDGTGTTYYPNETIPSVTQDMTLYAQWYQLPKPIVQCVYTTCNCICCNCRMSMKQFCSDYNQCSCK